MTVRGGLTARAVAVLAGVFALLTACGEPPRPLPTAPPEKFGDPSPATSSAPPFSLPPTLPGAVPGTGLPTYPAYPTYAPPLTPAARTAGAPATTAPKPARACTSGPTAAQVIALARAAPGVPKNLPMTVAAGPYCQSSWQYTKINTKAGEDPLLVVSTGAPNALKLVEAGQDVCSDKVAATAPAGIRVLACGG